MNIKVGARAALSYASGVAIPVPIPVLIWLLPDRWLQKTGSMITISGTGSLLIYPVDKQAVF
jgi:hypothetical protein